MRPISIGSLKDQKPCEFCNALLWPSETSQACCLKGKLYNKHSGRGLKFMPDPPVDIQHMLSKPSLAASLHNYNNCLAMASVGGNFPEQSVNYRIQGKLYHQIGSLGAPPPGERPSSAPCTSMTQTMKCRIAWATNPEPSWSRRLSQISKNS